MELTLETLKSELETSNEKIKADVKALVDEGSKLSDEDKAKLTSLEENAAKFDKTLKELDEQIKQKLASLVPGVEEEEKKFSMSKYLQSVCMLTPGHPQYNPEKAWENAGREKEIIDAYKKTNNSDDGSQGGYLVPTTQRAEIIELMTPQMPIMEMGVTQLTGLTGPVQISKLTGRPTGYMVDEEEAPTESETAFGNISLRPRKAGAFSKISNRLIFQTGGNAETIIKREIAKSLAILFNKQLIDGSGADKEVRGLMEHADNFSDNDVALGSGNGARFKIDDAADMILGLQINNEMTDGPTNGYLMRPEVLSGLKRQSVRNYAAQEDRDAMPINLLNPLMSTKMLEGILETKLRHTTQLSATEKLGTSSTLSNVIYGDWEQLYIAFFRDLVINVSGTAGNASGSAFTQDQSWIVAFQEFDCNVGRPEAFTRVRYAETKRSNW